MRKFLDVDIIESLRAIMERNTEHYKTDFDFDVQLFRKRAASPDPEDKVLLWMSRESGTWCLREREVFLQDTRAFHTWRAYAGKAADRVLAFSVEISGIVDGVVRGHLYQLNYLEHIKHVKAVALPVEHVAVSYGDGHTAQFPMNNLYAHAEALLEKHGKIEGAVYKVHNESELQRLFVREHRTRMAFPARKMDWFIKVMDRDPPPGSVRAKLEQAKQEIMDTPAEPGKKKGRDMCK